MTLPDNAVLSQGDVNEGYKHFCFVLENGKARRRQIVLGARGKGRVEVLKMQIDASWTKFTGEEKIVQGDLSSLSDGQEVNISTDDNTVQMELSESGCPIGDAS